MAGVKQQSRPPAPWELASALNEATASGIGGIAATEWDENHISFVLVHNIRTALANSCVTAMDSSRAKGEGRPPLHVQAQAYKVSGSIEQTHGDIVVAITHVVNGAKVTGLGFYEAKAASVDGLYPAFNMRQLRSLVSSTPRLSLLLYERSALPVQDNEFSFPVSASAYWNSSRVRVIGANFASRFRGPGFAAQYAQSFGYHFVTRYLSGRDLDYSRPPAEALRRWLRVTKRAPPLLVAVSVSNWEPEPTPPCLPEYVTLPMLSAERSRPLSPRRLSP